MLTIVYILRGETRRGRSSILSCLFYTAPPGHRVVARTHVSAYLARLYQHETPKCKRECTHPAEAMDRRELGCRLRCWWVSVLSGVLLAQADMVGCAAIYLATPLAAKAISYTAHCTSFMRFRCGGQGLHRLCSGCCCTIFD